MKQKRDSAKRTHTIVWLSTCLEIISWDVSETNRDITKPFVKVIMSIAAAITVPPITTTRRSLTSITGFRHSSSPPLQLNFFSAKATSKNPNYNLRCSAFSMNLQAVEEASPVSFLDRRESSVLHFVKYQGLGNDFILVNLSVRILLLICLKLMLLKC